MDKNQIIKIDIEIKEFDNQNSLRGFDELNMGAIKRKIIKTNSYSEKIKICSKNIEFIKETIASLDISVAKELINSFKYSKLPIDTRGSIESYVKDRRSSTNPIMIKLFHEKFKNSEIFIDYLEKIILDIEHLHQWTKEEVSLLQILFGDTTYSGVSVTVFSAYSILYKYGINHSELKNKFNEIKDLKRRYDSWKVFRTTIKDLLRGLYDKEFDNSLLKKIISDYPDNLADSFDYSDDVKYDFNKFLSELQSEIIKHIEMADEELFKLETMREFSEIPKKSKTDVKEADNVWQKESQLNFSTGIEKIRWNGSERQLIYLFDLLFNNEFISTKEYHDKRFSLISAHFKNKKGAEIKPKQLSTTASEMRDGKPNKKDARQIEAIIDKIIERD